MADQADNSGERGNSQRHGGCSEGGMRPGMPNRRLSMQNTIKLRHKVKNELLGLQQSMRLLQIPDDETSNDIATPHADYDNTPTIKEGNERSSTNVEIFQDLEKQLSEVEYQKKCAEKEVVQWKKKYQKIKVQNFELIKKMALKSKEQLQSHTETTKAQLDTWKGKYGQMGNLYDDLVEKVGDLSDENAKLAMKCQRLEENEAQHKEELAQLDSVKEECEVLHQSMEEAMEMATGMSDGMAKMVKNHKSSVQDYQRRMVELNAKLLSANLAQKRTDAKLEEANAQLIKAAVVQKQTEVKLEALREEGEVLRTQFREAEKFYEGEKGKKSRSARQKIKNFASRK
mmetsp:Transcript_5535/g.12067  ORF Transcript_5535/g.12067 Transcript_5535/m.12067 type:complete len:343 (+) Transcript_5535:170-1198(+)